MTRHELTLPDLGLPDTPVALSLWLVELGAEVLEGDRVVEILAGAATIDLPAPATGRLVEQLVLEDEILTTGQTLGIIEAE